MSSPDDFEAEMRRCSWYCLIALTIMLTGFVMAVCHGRDARYDAMVEDEEF